MSLTPPRSHTSNSSRATRNPLIGSRSRVAERSGSECPGLSCTPRAPGRRGPVETDAGRRSPSRMSGDDPSRSSKSISIGTRSAPVPHVSGGPQCQLGEGGRRPSRRGDHPQRFLAEDRSPWSLARLRSSTSSGTTGRLDSGNDRRMGRLPRRTAGRARAAIWPIRPAAEIAGLDRCRVDRAAAR